MARKNPSTRWFFKDWHNDEALQLCSVTARGVWIELLGLCAENGGYLVIDGKLPSITALARYVRAPPRTIGRALKELEAAGVFSRTDDGVIFNRRMVRANGIERQKLSDSLPLDGPVQHLDLIDNEPRLARTLHPHAPARRKLSKAFKLKDSESCDSESLDGAREGKKITEEESFVRPAGAFGSSGTVVAKRVAPPIMETPTRVVLAGANRGGTSDDEASLPSPVADNNRLGLADQGRAYPLTGAASSPSNRLGACHGRNCRPAHAARPRPPPKSMALKAKIKFQLQQKHARFLVFRRRPEELAAYWAAQLSDDKAEAQRVFDETDRQMRAAGWDDMHEWKRREGIAA